MSDLVERLEPCPFCGGEAELDNAAEPQFARRPTVTCKNEDCFGYMPSAYFARDVEAVAAWNRRAESPELARLRSEVERLTRERDEAQAGWKTASELLDAAVGDYNTEHVALTALTARTREVLAPFAEWFPEEALRRVPPDQRLMTTGLEARHFRAANTLFNELKEKDNG